MRRIGIGYRRELHDWILNNSELIHSLELTAEHFFRMGRSEIKLLKQLSQEFPIFVHGLGLSLGTPGPLCEETLTKFAWVAETADAEWVSEHVAFTRSAQTDLGHLNPICFDEKSLNVLVDHVAEVADKCGKRVLLENITSTIRFESAFSETDFLNQLCERSECALLLDVTNLFINSKNHQFDPVKWLHEIERNTIKQLHVVGYSKQDGHYHDRHAKAIQPDLLELVEAVFDYADVQGVTLERDERFSELDEIQSDLEALHRIDV